MVRQGMMQTMRRDTHLVKTVVGRFGDQIINSYDTIYISIGINAFKMHLFYVYVHCLTYTGCVDKNWTTALL